MSNTSKKIICYIFAIIVIFSGGFLAGRYSNAKKYEGQLSEDLNNTRIELEQLKTKYEEQRKQFDDIRKQFGGIGESVDESIGLLGQADESLGELGQSIQDIGNSIGNGRNTIECLKELNRATKKAITELQRTNSQLREELERIRRSSTK